MHFGKYKGELITTIIDEHPQYIQWAYNNTHLTLTEEEKYLLFKKLYSEGIIDKELLTNINNFPQITVEGKLNKGDLNTMLSSITSSPLYEERKPIKDIYENLMRLCEEIEKSFNNSDPEQYFYRKKDMLQSLSHIISKSKYVVSRPNFTKELKESAINLIDTIGNIQSEIQDFLASYSREMENVSTKINEFLSLKELQKATIEQEALKEERNTTTDRHPFKDIDETFLVKLDNILGNGEYNISQCIYRIDLKKDIISSIELRQLREVFGESRIEIRDNNEDNLSVYLTQFINSVDNDTNIVKDNLKIVHQFVIGLNPQDKENFFSLGKEETEHVLDRVVDFYNRNGNLPEYSQLLSKNISDKISMSDVKKWINSISSSEVAELSDFISNIGNGTLPKQESQKDKIDYFTEAPF